MLLSATLYATPAASDDFAERLSAVPARLHHAFSTDFGPVRSPAWQGEREASLQSSDALVRARVRLNLGRQWLGFLYTDMGAADSALRWQGLAGVGRDHGVHLLGGWRHVTYHFARNAGLDSLDFDGPYLGATVAW